MLTSNDKLQESAQSPSNKIDYRKSGMCGASLSHPVSGQLNSYDTTEEDADAIFEKKSEYQSLAVHKTGDFINTKSGIQGANVNSREMPEFDSVVTNDLSKKKEFMDQTGTETKLHVKRLYGSGSIYQSKPSCKWRAEFSNRNSKVHVGIYDTYEEAEAAIEKKKQELRAEEDRTPATIKPRGVYQRKSGKWFGRIRDPVTRRREYVGNYETAEQALEALNRKRRELDVLKNAAKKRKTLNCKVEVIEWEEVATKSWDAESGGDCSVKVDDAQMPCSSVDTNVIINADGQLVGEFSRLDDDMLLSLDDADEN